MEREVHLNSQVRVDRGEMARLLADGLRDLGYFESATQLEMESGFQATSEACKELLGLLGKRKYEEALEVLPRCRFKHSELGLVRARNALQQERYVEMLANHSTVQALCFLRMDLRRTQPNDELVELAALLACPCKQQLLQQWAKFHAKQFAGFGMVETGGEGSVVDRIKFLLDVECLVPARRLFSLLEQSLEGAGRPPSLPQGVVGSIKRFKRSLDFPYPLLRSVGEMEAERSRFFLPRHPMALAEVQMAGQEIWSLCFNPSGTQLALGTGAGAVIVLDSESLQVVSTLHNKNGDRRGPVRELDWRFPNWILAMHVAPPQGNGYSLDFNAVDGALIAVLGDGKCFSPPALQCFHAGRPNARWLSEEQVVCAGPDGWYKLWRIKDSTFTLKFCVPVERVLDLVVAAGTGGKSLVLLACADCAVRGYCGSQLMVEIATNAPPTRFLFVSPPTSNSHVLVALATHQFMVFIPQQQQGEGEAFGLEGSVTTVAALSTGDFLAVAGNGGGVDVYALPDTAQRVLQLAPRQLGIGRRVVALQWNPSRVGHLVAVGDEGSVWIWGQ
ncbi:hypothetical protein BASA81_002536 [Batrachochytrium salamandrivorans]|nr:hypothetical protein BASA81_002536 [Batrachochytrium salamandrivorans]